jgi:hypothetical protein
MDIDKKSRYDSTPLLKLIHPSGEEYELRELREIPVRTSVFAVTAAEDDRLDLLAARFYRDPLLFWRIADAADELDPFDVINIGEPVNIPPNKDK